MELPVSTAKEAHETVAAVVVTRNRLAQLEKLLRLLSEQTRALDEVIVFDNVSTDGTAEMLSRLAENVHVLRSEQNVGGAGGFHLGIREGWTRGHEWLWLMDDDAAPHRDALERLLARVPSDRRRPLILASRVLWPGDDRLHPMNRPVPRRGARVVGARSGSDILPIRAASFVSCLLHRSAVDRYGLPHAEYFRWNDDLEYTARVLRREPGYLVNDSIVLHETETAHTVEMADPSAFYFEVRNKLFMLRGPAWGPVERVRWTKTLLSHTLGFLRRQRFNREALKTVARGARDGLKPRS